MIDRVTMALGLTFMEPGSPDLTTTLAGLGVDHGRSENDPSAVVPEHLQHCYG